MKVNKEIKYVYYLTTIILPYLFRVFVALKHFYRTPENVVNLPKIQKKKKNNKYSPDNLEYE